MSLLIKTRPTLSSIDLWSGFGVITITNVANTLALPFIEVGGLPDGATITRAMAMLKWRAMMETTNNPVFLLNAQEIQMEMAVGGTWTDAIYLLNQQLQVPALDKEFGDVLIGSEDIKDQVPGNGEFIDFQWLIPGGGGGWIPGPGPKPPPPAGLTIGKGGDINIARIL